MTIDNYTIALIGVLVVGIIATLGAVYRMKNGFGPFNLRVLGIILVATFATVLGLANVTKLTASIGILGAIAGYLFGSSRDSTGDSRSAAEQSHSDGGGA